MRTVDELPEKFSHDDLRAANAKHWDQPGGQMYRNGMPAAAATPAPLASKGGNASSPSPGVPGGEKYSVSELASYSVQRGDRNYNGAGMAEMPPPFDASGAGKLVLPRKVAANSWQTEHNEGE